MKLEKARELEDLLKEHDKLCKVQDILSNYDATVEFKFSSVHNHNAGTSISMCLPVKGDDKDKVVSAIDSALQEIVERIDNF